MVNKEKTEKNLKPLLIILKTLIIGLLWSIVFIDGIRVLLLINWHFDIFLREHWRLLAEKWNSGSRISRSEIAFFLVIVSSIPLWLAGWIGLSIVKWKRLFDKLLKWPLSLYKKLTLKKKAPVVIKKKSITEETKIVQKNAPVTKKAPLKKPPLPSATLLKSNINNSLSTPSVATSNYQPASKKNPEAPTTHALFNFDEDDFDLDFDLNTKDKEDVEDSIPSALVADEPKKQKKENDNDILDIEAEKVDHKAKAKQNPRKENAPKHKNNDSQNNSRESYTPVLDDIKQKGYDIISPAIIKNITIDYIAVSKQQLILCLVDKETGDWLADEENFNDEEPLWFSESSHRISPVRKVDIARDILKTKLAIAEMNFDIIPYVIIQSGNIINAEDMFEIWNGKNVNVARIGRGSPKEIRQFTRVLETCEEKTDKNTFDKLKKLIHSLA